MKKVFLPAVIVIMLLFSSVYIYTYTGTNEVENKMVSYLEERGYSDDDILRVDVAHSLMNKLFARDEWCIAVEYVDEPLAEYYYTIKQDGTIGKGIYGNIPNRIKTKN